MVRLLSLLSDFRGQLFNLLFLVYAWALQPSLIRFLSGVVYQKSFHPSLVFFFLFFTILEFWALRLKLRIVLATRKYRSHEPSEDPASDLLLPLWIGHMLVSVILTMLVLQAAGMDMEHPNPIGMVAIVFQILKEIALLLVAFSAEDANRKWVRPHRGEVVSDIVLILYSWIALSTTWGVLTSHVKTEEPGNVALQLVYAFVASILFLIFYLPVRIPYLVEELSQVETGFQLTAFVVSLLFTTFMALFPIFAPAF